MEQADFTIADVLAWARTKPADGAYNYSSLCDCALGQFCGDADIDSFGDNASYSARLKIEVANREQLRTPPHTFGALVKRLEKLCPETPKSDWLAIDAYMADIESVAA